MNMIILELQLLKNKQYRENTLVILLTIKIRPSTISEVIIILGSASLEGLLNINTNF